MKADSLRRSILQLAVSGKLVDQRPEEGTAADLLKDIAAERERLVNAGTMKKSKPLPPVDLDDVPFEIPENWEWVRLGELCTKLTDGTHQRPKYSLSGIPFLSVKDMSCGKLDFSDVKYISEEQHQELYKRCNPKKGDLLLTKVGTTGIPVIVDTDREFSLFVSVALAKLVSQIDIHYLSYAIRSPCVNNQVQEKTKGIGNQNWVLRDIASTYLPLPPLAEQRRIVERLEELMPLIDKYDIEEQQLSKLDDEMPEKLRRSILQYAVSGKLVEQREEEGSAAELLKEIEEERVRLVKEGKIKKSKPLPPVDLDDVPFEIPASWEWVRLGDIVHNFGQKIPDSDFTYIDVASIDNQQGCLSEILAVLSPSDAPSRARKIVKSGCILYSTVRPYLLNICIVSQEFPYEPIASTAFAVLNPLSGVLNKYLYYSLRSPFFVGYVNDKSSGMAYPAINDDNLYVGYIPLPPLAEQKRIVERLDELMNMIEGLQRDKR